MGYDTIDGMEKGPENPWIEILNRIDSSMSRIFEDLSSLDQSVSGLEGRLKEMKEESEEFSKELDVFDKRLLDAEERQTLLGSDFRKVKKEIRSKISDLTEDYCITWNNLRKNYRPRLFNSLYSNNEVIGGISQPGYERTPTIDDLE